MPAGVVFSGAWPGSLQHTACWVLKLLAPSCRQRPGFVFTADLPSYRAVHEPRDHVPQSVQTCGLRPQQRLRSRRCLHCDRTSCRFTGPQTAHPRPLQVVFLLASLMAGCSFLVMHEVHTPTGFKVPLSPVTPAVGMISTLFLIGSLGFLAYIRFGVWLAIR